MRKTAVLFVLLIGVFGDAVGAARPTGRTVARSATVSRTTPRAATQPVAEAKTVSRARSAQPVATSGQSVVARAATTKKVVGTGTKVAVAAKNVVVNEECQQKFYGCMDSFCMLENETGGRCLCSNKNKELDTVLEEIEKLDQQTYQMATYGVERIEMGEDAEAVIAKANAVAQSVIENSDNNGKKKRKTLDLSLGEDIPAEEESEDLFGGDTASIIDGKEGDALYSESLNICRAQIPECASDMQMLQMMYIQNIKSDCAAYENSLKQQKKSSTQKLIAAEKALREAALEQFRTANKYDLGQCTVEFKKCMQTTGGCGDDFSKCATVVALDATNTRKSTSKKSKNYKINGAVTTIEISASTYDALVAKKPLCESVTKSCVNVAGQVWDTFLREVAPQIKNAELIAEDKARQNCIGNIASCFQKACKDNIDPNDPDGSYDMCLSRPGTMLNLCRVPLNACGIDASSQASAEKSEVWDYVLARLAAIRVNSCTTEVKECLQSEDRCGKDYSKCVGLDTDTIIHMCPYEKLTACYSSEYGEDMQARENYIYSVALGLILNIDNNMLTQCQEFVDEAMINVCGDVSSCGFYDDDIAVGMDSLASQQSQDNAVSISGLISFGNLKIRRNPDTWNYYMDVDDYMASISDAPADIKRRIRLTLEGISNEVSRKISIIASDPRVDMCINGRDLTHIRGGDANARDKNRTTARFPALLGNYTYLIANAILDKAKSNYDAKYAKLISDAMAESVFAKNALYCSALAARDNFASEVESYNLDAGIKSISPYEVVVSKANMDEVTRIIKENPVGESVILDPLGTMIAKVTTKSVYNPGAEVCHITIETYPCVGFEGIYNGKSVGFSVGATYKGYGGNIGTSVSKNTYQGNFCNAYAEPIVSEQMISLAAGGQATLANVTRSNLTSYTHQEIDNSTTKTTSVSLDANVGDNTTVGDGSSYGKETNKSVEKTNNTANINSGNRNSNNSNSGNRNNRNNSQK